MSEKNRQTDSVSTIVEAEKSPKISVIVPVYKVEKYLSECIESVLAQTFTDFELILVDDGSPDNSGKICDDYAKKDPRIRVFHKENGGVTSARRLGIENARGEWVMFVDGDDMVSTDSIELLLAGAQGEEIDLVEGGFFKTRNISACVQLQKEKGYGATSEREDIIVSGIEYAKSVVSHAQVWNTGPWAKIVRKKCLGRELEALEIPRWVKFGEDCLMCLFVATKIRMAKRIPNLVYFYRINPAGACSTFQITADYLIRWRELAREIFVMQPKKEWHDLYVGFGHLFFPQIFLFDPDFDDSSPAIRAFIEELKVRSRGGEFRLYQMCIVPYLYGFPRWGISLWKWSIRLLFKIKRSVGVLL